MATGTKSRRLAWSDERGVSAVIVAISLVAIFGAAMLSVDAGNLWQTRRGVITGTDSGALAEAKTLALSSNPTGCTTAWQAALDANTKGFPAAEYTGAGLGCTFYDTGNGTGYVTIAALRLSQAKFGKVVGVGDTKAFSLSAAMFGYVESFQGMRPVGFCRNNSHIQEWRALKNAPSGFSADYAALHPEQDVNSNGIFDQTDFNALPTTSPPEDTDGDGEIDAIEKDHPQDEYTGASWYNDSKAPHIIHRIRFDRDAAEDLGCGEDPGNWGYQDFNGGSNSSSEAADWFLNGFQGFVGIPGCNSDGSGDGCDGDTGGQSGGATCDKKASNVPQAMQCLVENQVEFPVVVYSSATCETSGGGGGGSNCDFVIAGILGMLLRGFEVGGAQANRYFDVEFTDWIPTGGCCVTTPSGLNLGANKGIRLCAVDHDPIDLAVRCTPTAT